jgi:REP element-mobilizing transposase RayT
VLLRSITHQSHQIDKDRLGNTARSNICGALPLRDNTPYELLILSRVFPMSNYRRLYVNGGTYFITQVTYQREPWLCSEIGRLALREAIQHVRQQYPFEIDAIVLLPDHFHALLTLPADDSNFSLRMRLIKRYVTKYYGEKLEIDIGISASRIARKEHNLWLYGSVGSGNI